MKTKTFNYSTPQIQYFVLENESVLCQSDNSINDLTKDTETFGGIFD